MADPHHDRIVFVGLAESHTETDISLRSWNRHDKDSQEDLDYMRRSLRLDSAVSRIFEDASPLQDLSQQVLCTIRTDVRIMTNVIYVYSSACMVVS